MYVYKRKDGKEFVVVTIMLEKELYEGVLNRYGKSRGVLSSVINNAVRTYLESGESGGGRGAHAQHARGVYNVYMMVKEKVAEILGVEEPYQAVEDVLDKAIALVRGADKRTIDKWKKVFEDLGLIEYVGGFKPKRIVQFK